MNELNMDKKNLYNIPNALSVMRLIGVPFLFLLILFENTALFLGSFIFLGLTDFFDGYLARKWNQVTQLGSMLDSIADIAYYLAAAYFLIILFPTYLEPNLPFFYILLVLFVLSVIVSKLKLGKVLILHTHLSRLSGVLVFFAFLASFSMDTTLMIRVIIILYTVAFIETTVIILKYGLVDPDTRSIFQLKERVIRK